MNISIRSRNLEVTDALKEYVEKKVLRLEKYFFQDLTAQVSMAVERDRHIIEITLPVDGLLLRGEESTEDMYASVDQVLDKIERQIHKYKTRINRKLRRDGNHKRGLVPEAFHAAESEDQEDRVVRVKHFPVKPMSVEEAILQMNLLGHDFFVFNNAVGEEISVIYRRRDGNYGLIEPE